MDPGRISGQGHMKRCRPTTAAKFLAAICVMQGTQGFVLPRFCPASSWPLSPRLSRSPERALAGASTGAHDPQGRGSSQREGALLVAMSEGDVEVWRGERRMALAGGALAAVLLGGFPKGAEAKDEILQRLEGDIVSQLPAGVDSADPCPAPPPRSNFLLLPLRQKGFFAQYHRLEIAAA